MSETEKTPEQIAAEKSAAKEAKAKERADAKAVKAAVKAQEKADKKAAKEKAKQDKAEAKAAAKAAAKQPSQNGITRPKPETKCGQAWAIFDDVSAKNCSPASIGETMPLAKAAGLNEGNVRAEYARWRKFHNVSGRIAAPSSTEASA